MALHLLDALTNLGQVLVGEGLVDTEVAHAPREVGGRRWLLAGARRAGDGIHADVLGQQSHSGRRQQGQLDGSGKATGVGQMLGLLDGRLVNLRQTVDVVVGALDAEVLGQVDNLHALGNLVLGKELLALAMPKAEKHDVDLVEGHLVGEEQIGVSNQSFVDVADGIPGIRLGVGKDNLRLGVIQQQTDEFASRVSGCA